MSKYLRVLTRLHADRAAEPGVVDSGETPAVAALTPFRDLPLAKRQAAYAGLLETLRARSSVTPAALVVVAGVTMAESIRPIVAGLIQQAKHRGLRVLSGELIISRDQRILRQRLNGDDSPSADAEDGGWSIELAGRNAGDAMRNWMAMAGADNDLLIVEAPPLLSSAEGALLAKEGGSLILVVEPRVTARRGFITAVSRAQASGCPILGLVMNGTREDLPRWLGKLFG